ncbi:hypothetical protein LR48_Vigan181s001800 [Vigna angularis]|uniref:Uncharacterized protein n=1 Tax=Phaseolus angularis TaxID=3914 RepID=A0A0L9T553_PHAAN|nr:hypothetical protein LR48_Vigan181s001800 [Vigna angularis]
MCQVYFEDTRIWYAIFSMLFLGHFVASKRSEHCPLLNPFLGGLFWIVLFISRRGQNT